MVPLPDDFMPYGPASVVVGIIQKCRDRSIPKTLSPDEFRKLGVAEGNIGRTAQSFRFLGLIDDEYNRTDKFFSIEKAQTDQYPVVLAQIVKDAYHEIFKYIDPAKDTDIAIGDQFRHYKPASVRDRMFSLFVALCAEAQLLGDRAKPVSPIKPSAARKNGPTKKTAKTKEGGEAIAENQQNPSPPGFPQFGANGVDQSTGWIIPLLTALPTGGAKWTVKQRENWVAALKANLMVWYPASDEDDAK